MERSREKERKQNLEKENKGGNENENGTVKSCKGFLFYSSALKSHNRDPLCIGIPRSLPQGLFFSLLPLFYSFIFTYHNVGLAEVKAHRNSAVVEDFSFVCAGYSLFMSKNEGSITKDGTKPQLPHCRGLAYLQHLAPPNPNPASAPAHVHSKGAVEPLRSQFPLVVPLFVLTNFWLFLFPEDHGVHQHQTRKSTYAVEDDFLNRQADDLTC
ncbi:hypothetical protein Goarm_016790 [Gossypium armourianum]|uniref:DUF8204 domain-containing protein n=1 Tax=Gossypium armourianum TaxID=34283 RepID=A0A7J9JFZ1_9ROSI|nr:hypothetical protein [Gossypium armourianum]